MQAPGLCAPHTLLPAAGVRSLLADDTAPETSIMHMQRAPTEFMCLLLKLLQLQPEKEIIVEFIKNEDYKYIRVLGKPCFWFLHLFYICAHASGLLALCVEFSRMPFSIQT